MPTDDGPIAVDMFLGVQIWRVNFRFMVQDLFLVYAVQLTMLSLAEVLARNLMRTADGPRAVYVLQASVLGVLDFWFVYAFQLGIDNMQRSHLQ